MRGRTIAENGNLMHQSVMARTRAGWYDLAFDVIMVPVLFAAFGFTQKQGWSLLATATFMIAISFPVSWTLDYLQFLVQKVDRSFRS